MNTARLSASAAAVFRLLRKASSSMSSTAPVSISPFSNTATRSSPISIGSMPNLVSNAANLSLITSPSFATTASSLITTLPDSMPVFILSIPNSPIIGPGAKLVGPALTVMFLGAFWPGLIGAFDLFFFNNLNNAKGFSLVNSNAGIPLTYFSSSFMFCFLDCSNANLMNLFLVISNNTLPLSWLLMLLNCFAGRFSMLTMPINWLLSMSSTNWLTACLLRSGTALLAVVFFGFSPSEAIVTSTILFL